MNTALTTVESNPKEYLIISPGKGQEPDITGMFGYIAGELTESTVLMYQHAFRAYMAYAQAQGYSPLEHTTLEGWRDSMIFQSTKSPNTINRMLASIKRVMKEARKHDLISRDEAYDFAEVSGASMKRLKDRIKQEKSLPLFKAQMQELCNLPDETTLLGMRDRALLWTLATSGVRASELASLLVSRVFQQENGCFIQVMGKTDAGFRDANLSPHAYELIQMWLSARVVQSPYVFTSFADYGKTPITHKMTARSVWNVCKEYSKQVEGLAHLSPHSFRHYVASSLAKVDIRIAQVSLGHASISTTQLYVHDSLTIGATDGLV